jgi:hypothetical protein
MRETIVTTSSRRRGGSAAASGRDDDAIARQMDAVEAVVSELIKLASRRS